MKRKKSARRVEDRDLARGKLNPARQSSAGAANRKAAPTTDVLDSEADLHAFPKLRPMLEFCEAEIARVFAECDERALRLQRLHQWSTNTAAFVGTIALLIIVTVHVLVSPFRELMGGITLLVLSSVGGRSLLKMFCQVREEHSSSSSVPISWSVRWLVSLAAWVGGLAVAASVFVPIGSTPSLLVAVEFGGTAAAAVLVFLAIRSQLQQGWLLVRHKAERLRSLKFTFLIDPRTFSTTTDDRIKAQQEFTKNVGRVRRITASELEHWSEEDALLERPDAVYRARVEDGVLKELVSYYSLKRLEFQKDYLSRSAESPWWLAGPLRELPFYLFYGGVGAALGRFLIPHFKNTAHQGDVESASQTGSEEIVANLLVFLALALPIIAAGWRTFRAAHEFTRNTLRSRAKLRALEELSGRLAVGERVYDDLWHCEHVLNSDQREWLRLMREAEWYG